MTWGAWEPPSKRPPWGKSQVAASSDPAVGSAGPETRRGGVRETAHVDGKGCSQTFTGYLDQGEQGLALPSTTFHP